MFGSKTQDLFNPRTGGEECPEVHHITAAVRGFNVADRAGLLHSSSSSSSSWLLSVLSLSFPKVKGIIYFVNSGAIRRTMLLGSAQGAHTPLHCHGLLVPCPGLMAFHALLGAGGSGKRAGAIALITYTITSALRHPC